MKRSKHTCNRCGYVASQKSNFENHMNRKRPCKPTVNASVVPNQPSFPPTISFIPTYNLPHSDPQSSSFSLIPTPILPHSLRDTTNYCEACKTDFKNSKAKTLHISKCTGTSPFECRKCGLHFTTTSNRIRHEKRINCQERRLAVVPEGGALATTTAAATAANNAGAVITHSSNNTNTMTHSNNVTTTNNNINITVNALGKESVGHLEDNLTPDMRRFMMHCIKGGTSGVCQMVIRKHFDEQHPENQNIRKCNKKDDFMEFHDGSTWQVDIRDNVLKTVFARLERTFSTFVDGLWQGICQPSQMMRKQWIDDFMKKVGEPLEWDLTSTQYDYEFDESMTAEQKEQLRNKIFSLAAEYVYRSTKKMVESGQVEAV